MLIYTLSMGWMLLCEALFRKRETVLINGVEERHATRLHAFMAIFFLIFFIGLRSAGADTAAYIIGYRQLPTGLTNIFEALSEKEGLFRAFGIFVKTFVSREYYPYLFLIALISGVSVTETLRKSTPYFTSALVLFVLTGTFGWMINGIRQFLAASLAFAATPLILKKKPIVYILVILILSKIHTSALLLIPIYFLASGKPFTPKTFLLLGVAVFAIFFTSEFTDLLGSALEETTYEGVMEGEIWQADDGSNPLRTVIYAVPVVLAVLDWRDIQQNAPPIIHLCVNMSIICVCFSLMANVTSGVFIGRIPIYFSPYNLILLPWLANRKQLFSDSRVINILMFGTYAVYYWMECRMYYLSDLLNLYFR